MVRLVALISTLLVTGTGCATTGMGESLRVPEDVPTHFVTEDGQPAVQECRSPLVDPRDQTRLRLARSAHIGSLYRGDYEVPDGKYGLREGELLRINCETGQVIGIVPN